MACLTQLAWLTALIVLVSPAQSEPVLRVRSTPHFNALRVSSHPDGFQVTGALLDELNEPVAQAIVTLPGGDHVQACANPRSLPRTDDQGRFCAITPTWLPRQRVTFAGDVHFETTSEVIDGTVDTPRPELSINTAATWIRGASPFQVQFQTSNVPPNSTPHVALNLIRDEQPLVLSPPVPLDTHGELTLQLDASKLPSAGNAVLKATLTSGRSAILATQEMHVQLLANVTPRIEQAPNQFRSGEEVTATFAVDGDREPVSSGWIELLADGRSLGMAPVIDDNAALTFVMRSARQRPVTLTARYVPEYPWYRAGPASTYSVVLLAPLPWIHVPWALLALGATLWVVRTWRRPSRSSAQARRGADEPQAGIRIIEQTTAAGGWSGTVSDAHSGRPIASARVSLVTPSLSARPPLRESITDTSGAFLFDSLGRLPEGSKVDVQAPQYSTLSQPAPQPCVMDIRLVQRRRTLLTAFHRWVQRAGAPQHREVTPQRVVTEAQAVGQAQVADWAVKMDHAIFGPEPPDSGLEETLLRQLPPTNESPSQGR